ncbi:MAG: TlpA disulfide reductase family protein [Bacteroidales bacterium]|nr:TlpA disulfide reductase family protein [Bacteroidales bacterium]
MKKLSIFMFFVLSFGIVNAQQFPEVNLKDLNGKSISSSTIKADGKPMIICFWKSCCPVNEKMLDALSEVYEDWQDEFGVKIYAVSVDDSRTSAKVKPTVNGKGWELEFLQDVNSDFKRALSVPNIPYILIYDSKGELITQRTGFQSGYELDIYEILKEKKK